MWASTPSGRGRCSCLLAQLELHSVLFPMMTAPSPHDGRPINPFQRNKSGERQALPSREWGHHCARQTHWTHETYWTHRTHRTHQTHRTHETQVTYWTRQTHWTHETHETHRTHRTHQTHWTHETQVTYWTHETQLTS